MKEDEIVAAVKAWFRRGYGAGKFCGECTLRSKRRADLIYVQRADSIHVVEAKAHASDYLTAFRQLSYYPANYKWLALPQNEYDDSTFIATECSERGYGLLLISGGPSHRLVAARRQPEYKEGRFDSSWPDAFCR